LKIKLAQKKLEAINTISFTWQLPKKVNFLPGQYFYFTLPDLKFPDERGPTRHFTISSSPTRSGFIAFTTRMRKQSGFKKTLDKLAVGSEIEAEGPTGTFILDEHDGGQNHVLIAGGIGITPFRAFIKYNIDKKLSKTKIYLIYSNSTPGEIAFKTELEKWADRNDNIKIAMTITKSGEHKKKWSGLTGRIDAPMIEKLLIKWGLEKDNVYFWLCGPPQMVTAMNDILLKMKVSAKNIILEIFTGY
jgi:ferredoxin-NADP reductase